MNHQFRQQTLSFLTQMYEAAHSDYGYSLTSERVPGWDWVVITAANAHQAAAYRAQLDAHRAGYGLPAGTRFVVLADRDDSRIGSGGATLNALHHIAQCCDGAPDWRQLKILMIHSGGDSKRVPQYSVCGKLFAPVMRKLASGKNATLFDEILALTSGIPSRAYGGGVLIVPGDTQILFNPIQLELRTDEAAALSIRVPVSVGKDHGVFLCGQSDYAEEFLHKQIEAELRARGAVGTDGNVDLDTGYIWLGGDLTAAMYALISDASGLNAETYERAVHADTCLSLYSDFIYPLTSGATFEGYMEQTPEKGFSENLDYCRRSIWSALEQYRIRVFRLQPARYIHVGSTREAYDYAVTDLAQYSFLTWGSNIGSSYTQSSATLYNTLVAQTARLGAGCYLEHCTIGPGSSVGEGCVLSNLEVQNLALPSGIVLDAIALLDGRHVVRIYGIDDNPKASVNGSFLGATLYDFLAMCKCPAESVWRSAPYTLWNAELYPLCDSHEQALDEALRIYRIASGSASSEDIDHWKRAAKTSLMASAGNADTLVMLSRQTELACRIRVERCVFLLEHSASAQEALRELHGSARERAQLEEYARTCGFPLTMRIFSLLALLSEQRRYPDLLDNGYEDESFAAVSKEIIRQVSEEFPPEEARFVSDASQVLLPLRINFCGSPSDAAPYCLEHGGTMLNAAILLNGRRPVRARVERLGEPVVLLESIDQNLHRRFDSLEELLHCSDVHDPFSLHKSTLIVTGLLHRRGDEVGLQDILRRLGGGIRLSTATDDVPKGSGLGTSSIIAAACVRALHQAFGLSAQDEKVYAQVFAAEQLMSTGGGWQDQVGGLTGGFKYISSQPGIRQRLKLEPLALSVATREELQQRFALIFSGQRRLARNVLRQEMARCIRCEPDTLEHMQSIRKLCALMKYELERGAVTEFASLLTQQFELVKRIDAGASNTYIEYIFDLCSHLIDGKSVCGAGGGGFLQVILKKGVTHDMLRRHISDNFSNCSISVWDSSFLWELD